MLSVINDWRYDERVDGYLNNVAATLNLKLRKIFLYKISTCTRFLKQIGIFQQLDELALMHVHAIDLDQLSSPSLQTIAFKRARFNLPIQLETPNLSRFIFWNWTFIDDSCQEVSLSYPQRIVYMESKQFWYSNMPNLEHLICHEIEDSINFKNYPKLRKLEYYPERSDQALNRIERLKEHQRWFSKDLEIFVSGFKLNAKFCEPPVFFHLRSANFCYFPYPKTNWRFFPEIFQN